MFDWLLTLIAPHSCYGCGDLGQLLCQKCKNYITRQPLSGCLVCGASATRGICRRHKLPYQRAYCVGRRQGVLKRLIDDYKFHRVQAAASVLAALFDATLPRFDQPVVLVPIPTAPRNTRRRGYDHMRLAARQLARRRGLPLRSLLYRRSNAVQHFAVNAAQRRRQAKEFFGLRGAVSPDATYILLDDIFTTGSTLREAANVLREAGATDIAIAVIARQGAPQAATTTQTVSTNDDA